MNYIRSNITDRIYDSREKNIPKHQIPTVCGGVRMIVCLNRENKIVYWGDKYSGTAYPTRFPGDEIFVQIDMHANHGIGVTSEGHLKGWGVTSDSYKLLSKIPYDNEYIQVSVYDIGFIALKKDGSTKVFSSNNLMGNMSGRTGFVQVQAGSNLCGGLKVNGSIEIYGPTPYNNARTDFIQVAINGNHAIGLTKDGDIIFLCGNSVITPPIGKFVSVKRSVAGADQFQAIKEDGSMVIFGATIKTGYDRNNISYTDGVINVSKNGDIEILGNDTYGAISTKPNFEPISFINAKYLFEKDGLIYAYNNGNVIKLGEASIDNFKKFGINDLNMLNINENKKLLKYINNISIDKNIAKIEVK